MTDLPPDPQLDFPLDLLLDFYVLSGKAAIFIHYI